MVLFPHTAQKQVILVNPLNAELNPICHLLALLGGETIVVVSRLRVNAIWHLNSELQCTCYTQTGC